MNNNINININNSSELQKALKIIDENKDVIKVPLYSIKKNKLMMVNVDEATKEMYYLNYRIPTDNELKKSKIKMKSKDVKKLVSMDITYIPLFDNVTFNLYVIQKRNVYLRIINNNYRFPDIKIVKTVIREQKKLKEDIENGVNDKIVLRKYKKTKLMLRYLEYFDMFELYNSYLRVFYRYNPLISKITFTCLRRSFIPHKKHLEPYYQMEELVKLALNMEVIKIPENTSYIDFEDSLTDKHFDLLCSFVQNNDISAITLAKHQNYIIQKRNVGLIQFYTSIGSYTINSYLREYIYYRDPDFEHAIYNMWNLIANSPAFDNDYILYRFVEDDSYMSDLEVGDIYMDKGFMSTTRNPFYSVDGMFGKILIKIRIPKNVKGIGICLETLSYFPNEEEIVLSPQTKLKLIKKDNDIVYFHPESSISNNVSKKYEFEWVGNVKPPKDKVIYENKPEYNDEQMPINLLNTNKIYDINHPYDFLYEQTDELDRIYVMIGDKGYHLYFNEFDSTNVYSDVYTIKTTNGLYLYLLHEGNQIFNIELGYENNNKNNEIKMHVNFLMKFTEMDRRNIISDKDFLHFIASLSSNFDVNIVIISCEYHSCDYFGKINEKNLMENKEELNSINNKKIVTRKLGRTIKVKPKDIGIEEKIRANILNDNLNYLNSINQTGGYENKSILSINYTGGTYNIDFYNYLKHGIKRYDSSETGISTVNFRPRFRYYDLDTLKLVSPSKVLDIMDRDEMYQIYTRTFLPLTRDTDINDTIADMYIWIIENNCYMINMFVEKLVRIYDDKNVNPFNNNVYIFDVNGYLYDKGLIKYYERNYGGYNKYETNVKEGIIDSSIIIKRKKD